MLPSLAAPRGDTIPGNGTAPPRTRLWALTVGSIGIVYGDIGTSPLYAFREAVNAAAAGGPPTRTAVLGVLSLIVWALIVVVTMKYVLILLRAAGRLVPHVSVERSWKEIARVAQDLMDRRFPHKAVLAVE